MKRHIGLVVLAVALLAMTADMASARGGRSGQRSFRFHNSGFVPNFSPNFGSFNNSASLQGTSTTRASRHSASRKSNGTSVTGQQTATSTASTRTLTTSPATQTTTNTTPIATKATPASTVSTAQSPTVTTSPFAITPSISIPLDFNAAAQRTYGPLLHNAKQLIKAGVYPPAAKYLQRIITRSPGTRIANEAQRLLTSLPV